jgi:hypothetical protein
VDSVASSPSSFGGGGVIPIYTQATSEQGPKTDSKSYVPSPLSVQVLAVLPLHKTHLAAKAFIVNNKIPMSKIPFFILS